MIKPDQYRRIIARMETDSLQQVLLNALHEREVAHNEGWTDLRKRIEWEIAEIEQEIQGREV